MSCEWATVFRIGRELFIELKFFFFRARKILAIWSNS